MPSPVPVLMAFTFVALALAVALFEGIGGGSVIGGGLALAAAVPACWGMFAGMQSKGSYLVLYAISLLVAALALAVTLWTLQIVSWLR